MKRASVLTVAAALVAVPLALAAEKGKPGADKAAKAKGDAAQPAAAETVVAVVDGNPITMAQLEEMAGARLMQLRNQEYTIKRQALEGAISKRLAEKEAAARGISIEELFRTEIEAKVPAVTEAEQKAFYEQNKGRFGGQDEAEALKQIEAYLRQQKVRERQQQFVAELKGKSAVKITLDPPRVKVDVGDDPSRGPANAPVTLVEFSDFQCPYCSRAMPMLQRLHETYGDKLRLVFRDYPLLQIHPQAAKAAEAATCAAEQGKFWEMHDRLFADQAKLQVADLKQHAVALGLNGEAFNQCLDSGKHEAEWKKDVEEGTRYGLTGTPTFFINGRLMTGADFEAFAAVIDEELVSAGITPPARTAMAAPTSPATPK